MKKQFILGIMALAALVSCSKSEVIQGEESQKDKSISFSTFVGKSAQSKATVINRENVATTGIGILAWRTGDADIDEATILNVQAPEFMPNIKLTWDNDKQVGTYKPERYWPSTGAKVSFYAYAPYTDGSGNAPAQVEDAEGNMVDAPNAIFHPENITATFNAAKAHILTLTVPKTAENTGVEYAQHTDFMVARKGENAAGDGVLDSDPTVTVGKNQNLNKDFDGKVSFNLKHALSKISFVAKAVDNVTGPQNEPYSDGTVKVVFDYITVNGNFASKGSYNLFTEAWTIDNATAHTSYSLVNAEGTENDPFNPIADEVYNHQGGTDETNTPDANGWYKLNKSSHDLMVLPFAETGIAGTITSVEGQYTVKTYKKVESTDAEGNPVVNYEEIVEYRDEVSFEQDLSATPITLKEGKSYVFQFNIKLRKIDFSIEVEDWAADENNSIVDTND